MIDFTTNLIRGKYLFTLCGLTTLLKATPVSFRIIGGTSILARQKWYLRLSFVQLFNKTPPLARGVKVTVLTKENQIFLPFAGQIKTFLSFTT
jgi:hypothetical protein